MKKLIVLLLAIFAVASCSTDTNEPKFHVVLVPVESFELPDTLLAETPYDIKMTYRRISTCQGFDDFYYQKDGNVRTIGIQNIVFENNDCQPLENSFVEKSFSFFAASDVDSYIFRFYIGNGTNGEAEFTEVEVPVVN